MSDVNELIELLRRSDVLDDPSLRVGIAQYSALQQDRLNTPDVTIAPNFQRKFRSFYRVRRDAAWQRVFFPVYATTQDGPTELSENADGSGGRVDRCEASFSSKLAATLNPKLPVLDSLVLGVMRTHLADRGSSQGKWALLRTGTLGSRLERAATVYNCLTATMGDILGAAEVARLIELFDKSYGQYSLTDTKKLDLMLWRYGARLLK